MSSYQDETLTIRVDTIIKDSTVHKEEKSVYLSSCVWHCEDPAKRCASISLPKKEDENNSVFGIKINLQINRILKVWVL